MTEKEAKAIERLKYINRHYYCNNYYFKYDLDCIDTVIQALEQKDNEIFSMARYIADNDTTELFCVDDENKDCSDEECIKCVRQHFEKGM